MEQERNMYESEVHRKYTARMSRLDAVIDLSSLIRNSILTSQLALELKGVVLTGDLIM